MWLIYPWSFCSGYTTVMNRKIYLMKTSLSTGFSKSDILIKLVWYWVDLKTVLIFCNTLFTALILFWQISQWLSGTKNTQTQQLQFTQSISFFWLQQFQVTMQVEYVFIWKSGQNRRHRKHLVSLLPTPVYLNFFAFWSLFLLNI